MKKYLLLPLFLLGCISIIDTEKEAIRILKVQGYSNINVHNSVERGCGRYTSAHEWTAVKNGINYRGQSCCSHTNSEINGCTKSYEIPEN